MPSKSATKPVPKPAIVWFRRDLRITDNPALYYARESGAPLAPVFIYDQDLDYAPGAASQWWLHHSLAALGKDLEKAGAPLMLRRGDSRNMLLEIIEKTGAGAVYWNRRYVAEHIAIDKKLKADLEEKGVDVHSFNGALLREPWEVETKSGTPFRVFTPFWKTLRQLGPSRLKPFPRMRKIDGLKKSPSSDRLKDWNLTPEKPNWAKEIAKRWTPGEKGARQRLQTFLSDIIENYADGRNRPDQDNTSMLSPHLAWGEISPLQIWRETELRMNTEDISRTNGEKFLSELAWREFSYSLLYHNPKLPSAPLQKQFKQFPWRRDKKGRKAWREGNTGYPIVDAGMRQLWRIGWMHNRVRMITASFLIKDLLIRWQDGEAWFWDTLVDADLANNSASWQWVAGSGADASPYFRIFNPVTQGEKFDPNGDYVREYVPELADLPAKYIHAPWKAPADILQKAGVTLGKNYPKPILDHAAARKRALEGYNVTKDK